MAKIYIVLSFVVIISSCLLLFLLYSYARCFNMQSVYLKKLLQEKPDVGQRYLMKLTVIKDLYPFTLANGDLDYSISGIPTVTYPDIFAYIVLTHSFYTHEQMKAYKSFDAHKYFTAGFVLKVGSMILNDLHVMVGKVKHSQRGLVYHNQRYNNNNSIFISFWLVFTEYISVPYIIYWAG